MAPRRYDNSRRAAQARATVVRILDATIDLLGAPDATLSLPDIAAAAGVSVPTVNKYFPTRDAIFAAAQGRLEERLGRPPRPTTLADLRATIAPLHQYFAANERMVRAALTAPPLRPFWDATHAFRDQGTQPVLAEVTAHLSAGDATAVRAILLRILGAEGWLDLRDRWRVPPESITRVARWAVDALLGQLARDGRAARRDRGMEEETDDRRAPRTAAHATTGRAHATPDRDPDLEDDRRPHRGRRPRRSR